MSDSPQLRGTAVLGGAQTQYPGRKLDIEEKLFSNTEQTIPIRLLRGQDKFGGVHIFPVFGFYTKDAPQSGGGK